MKTLIQTKYPTSNLKPQTPSRGTSAVPGLGVGNSAVDSRCFLLRALRSAWLVVILLSCLCRPVFAADTSAASPQLSFPPEQQARLDGLKAKGDRKSTRLNSSHLGI